MKTFHSYGPINTKKHYYVPRKELIEKCIQSLIGDVEEDGGHYFTIWGARQTGKTWIVEQSVKTIRQQYKDQFNIAYITIQGFADDEQSNIYERFFSYWPIIDGIDVHLVVIGQG